MLLHGVDFERAFNQGERVLIIRHQIGFRFGGYYVT